MKLSILSILAAALVVNALPNPNGGDGGDEHPTEPEPTNPPSSNPTPTNTGPPTPTGTGGTGTGDCVYRCTGAGAVIDVLECTNVLTGIAILVPIGVGKKREVRRRDVDYCCKPDSILLDAVSCVDIGSGSTISLPITLFPGISG
ncbi:hypothetical protein B0O99DRAFT_690030 [Bisporella sp. PMI_857]|nr:hypothetical protein B0O99DRAFT_690030 [Bisporella sp. PMI_857]